MRDFILAMKEKSKYIWLINALQGIDPKKPIYLTKVCKKYVQFAKDYLVLDMYRF